MPQWSRSEVEQLEPVLEAMVIALGPIPGREVAVLCSARGELAIRLALKVGVRGKVIGLERSERLILAARELATAAGCGEIIEFASCPVDRLPLPDMSVDAVISDSIVDSTPLPTDIGQPEMARVLRPGGTMVVTDLLGPSHMSHGVRDVLAAIGLNSWCEASEDDFRAWMLEADLVDVGVADVTWMVKRVWQQRAAQAGSYLGGGFEVFLGNGPFSLGKGFRYVMVSGRKPPVPVSPPQVAVPKIAERT